MLRGDATLAGRCAEWRDGDGVARARPVRLLPESDVSGVELVSIKRSGWLYEVEAAAREEMQSRSHAASQHVDTGAGGHEARRRGPRAALRRLAGPPSARDGAPESAREPPMIAAGVSSRDIATTPGISSLHPPSPSAMADKYPRVEGGGSLILAWQIKGKRVLVVGGGEVSH